MSYQLYGELGSGAGIIEVALAAAGVPYDWREVSLEKSEQRSEAYARLNPQRKLPTLITPAGETLTESAAILLVLDERHPAARLFPLARTPERAQALRWLVFAAAELYPLVEISDYPERFTAHGGNAPATRELVRSLWRERWLIVESQIAGEPWLSPSGFWFCRRIPGLAQSLVARALVACREPAARREAGGGGGGSARDRRRLAQALRPHRVGEVAKGN